MKKLIKYKLIGTDLFKDRHNYGLDNILKF